MVLALRDMQARGRVSFRFPHKPTWDQDVDVFVATSWTGAPHAASDEITPEWHDLDRLPFDRMWDDAPYWLPEVLAGRPTRVTCRFAGDNATVRAAASEWKPLENGIL